MSSAATDIGAPFLPAWTVADRPADGRAVVAAVAAGVLTDLVLRAGPPTLIGAVAILGVCAAVIVSGRLANVQAVALVACAPLFGIWLMLRTSEALLVPDILAAGLLLALGVSHARGGSILDLDVPSAAKRALHGAVNCALGAGFLAGAREARGRPGGFAAVLRGLAISLPVVLTLGIILSAGDIVFASVFRFDPSSLLLHGFVFATGAWAMGGLLRTASAPQLDVRMPAAPKLGRTEWTTVLVSVDVLFAAFALSRLVAASEGGRRVIRTAGLTYAEYARSGFFELLAVVAITLAILVVLRAVADRSEAGAHRRLAVLGALTVALTLVVVGSALQRLYLYQQAFGMTRSRLFSALFCVWLACALVLLAAWIAAGGRRNWFWVSAGGVALAMLLALNVAGPERIVIEMNVGHAQRTGELDSAYLMELGDDALPAIEGSMHRLPDALAAQVRAEICESAASRWAPGWPSYNRAHAAAVETRTRLCAGGTR